MEELEMEIIYENMTGLKVYNLVEDGSYAVINGDEDLEPKNYAVCFDDLLDILKRGDLPGASLALRALSKKRDYYMKREMLKATDEKFLERFDVLFINSAERFGGLVDFYFGYDKKDKGYFVAQEDELMVAYENGESLHALFEDMDALIEDLKERDGIVKNLATDSTKHRQFEMGIKYLELLKANK